MKIVPWEVVIGCERISLGCDNCPTYWEFKKEGWDYHPSAQLINLREPLRKDEPTCFIVASGSDLFHESISTEFIQTVFEIMKDAEPFGHQFEVVTKRAERMEMVSNRFLAWPDNAIAGVAVEEGRYNWRIDCLRNINARRLVSFGPLTGKIGKVDLQGIEVAGPVPETWGPNPRHAKQEWIDEIELQCKQQGVRLFEANWIAGSK